MTLVGPRRPSRVLVIGSAGGVGSALVQLAHYLGIVRIGTVSSPRKAAFPSRLGADHVIDYKQEDVAERVLALTQGKGVDAIFDHAGGPNFTDYLKLLADAGARWCRTTP